MRRRRISRKQRRRLSMVLSFFIIMTIPVVIFALTTSESLDPSSDADEDRALAYCTMKFPFVNPETIEAGKTVQIEVNGYAPSEEEKITTLLIKTSENQILLDKTYDEPQMNVAERVTFTTEQIGDFEILGQMETEVINHPCIMEGVRGNMISTMEVNTAPNFTSSPTSALPSNSITVNDSYTYELNATDAEGDDITYAYSFTPRADWMNMSVIQNGNNGTLKIKFEGVADQPASYLANVFIHDGYNAHLRSQSWVISVTPRENDTPVVTITEPTSDISINKGEQTTISWTGSDQNQIIKYRLYYASNPGNRNTWEVVDEEISYKVGSYIVGTNTIDPGAYKFIVEAEDNQDPSATGFGLSPQVAIIGPDGKQPAPVPDDQPKQPEQPKEPEKPKPPEPEEPEEPEEPVPEPPDDGIVLQEAQVVNLNPSEDAVLTNNRRTISATLVAAEGSELIENEITLIIDEKDVSSDLEISQISNTEGTIIYKPVQDFDVGEHKIKVYFKDSGGNEAEREWNFMIEEGEGEDQSFLSFLGFNISNRTILIVVIGIGIILLALIIPWLLYIAWRDSDSDYTTSVYEAPPKSTGSYPYNSSAGYQPPTHAPAKSVGVPTGTMAGPEDKVNEDIAKGVAAIAAAEVASDALDKNDGKVKPPETPKATAPKSEPAKTTPPPSTQTKKPVKPAPIAGEEKKSTNDKSDELTELANQLEEIKTGKSADEASNEKINAADDNVLPVKEEKKEVVNQFDTENLWKPRVIVPPESSSSTEQKKDEAKTSEGKPPSSNAAKVNFSSGSEKETSDTPTTLGGDQPKPVKTSAKTRTKGK